jgi:hypothetical protein
LPSKMENMKVKFAFRDTNPGVRKGLISSLAILCLVFNSCATARILPRQSPIEEKTIEGKTPSRAEGMRWPFTADKYFRIYSMDFSSFHPKVNSALQEYAQKHKGNSFRVVRLGSDGVLIKGYFKSDRNQERFSTEMAIKPAGQKRTHLEIKLSNPNLKMDANSLEKAYQELFGIIERGTGIGPPA